MEKKTYRDFDTYLRHFPTRDGRFGEYGGQYLPPELMQAFREIDDAYETICNSAQFINELRQRYDMVFIDSAPVAMVSDSLSLVGHADAVVYVTRANYTKRSLVKYANDLVARGQLRNVAMVINDTTPSLSAGYGYGYASSDDDE